jgi:Domain of Unknown Function (DUF1206)
MRTRPSHVTVTAMSSAAQSAESAARSAEGSARGAANSKWVKTGARVGLVSYGITHLLIGWIALQVALGSGDQKANQQGAFEELAKNPLGAVLLWVLVVGFVAIAIWRASQVVWGFGYESDKTKRLRKRASSGGKAVVFVVLAVLAARTAAGSGGGGGGGQKAAAGVLGLPGGQLLVGAAGIAIMVAGGVKIWAGWKKKFLSDMDLPSDQRARLVAERAGQVGFIARGVVTVIVGILVVVAAVRFRPEEANGLDAALHTLARQPFGPYLLGAVALGLFAYGVFLFFDARYHRV